MSAAEVWVDISREDDWLALARAGAPEGCSWHWALFRGEKMVAAGWATDEREAQQAADEAARAGGP